MNYTTAGFKNEISVGAAILLYVTLVVVALSIGIGSYMVCRSQEIYLQTQRYLPWNGTLPWVDFLSIPYYWISPGQNIWYKYQPSITLCFAFLNNPWMIGLRSGFIVLISEIIAALALVRWYQVGTRFPLFICLLAFSIFGYGVYGLFPGDPDSFTFDIANNSISRSLNQSSDSVRLSDATNIYARTIARGFSVTACQKLAYCHVYTRVSVQGNFLSDFDLVTLSSATQSDQLQILLNGFLMSHGSAF